MGDMFRVRTQFTGSRPGVPYLSTLYFGTSLYVVDDAVTATLDFWTAIKGQFTNGLTAEVLAEVAVISDVDGSLQSVEFATTAGSIGGDNSNEPLPPATQGLVRIGTNDVVGGRILKGHIFIPGATEANSSSGVPSSEFISVVGGAMNDLIDDVGSELRIWSRTHGASALATGATVWSQWAVLRSRRD